ncbi:MAG TPA: energy transducer TonB [Edaphocola sp.]|nr:energy transducer TonB [Edaphocola sp.]
MAFHLNFEQQKNAKAIGITIGVHLLLLLFFLFYRYSMPMEAPSAPMGLEVNLGTSEDGFGIDQPEQTGSPADANLQQSSASNARAAQNAALHGLMTTDNQDAAAVAIHDNKTDKRHNRSDHPDYNKPDKVISSAATLNNRHKETVQKPKYIFAGSKGDGKGNDASRDQAGGSEGIGTGDGDMGVPGGTPGAANYKGIPGGNGNMYIDLKGRFLVSRPDKAAKFREGGKVVFKVTVDRNGNITDYSLISAANATIKALAIQKLKAVKFNKAPNALPEQFGTITFDFTTH